MKRKNVIKFDKTEYDYLDNLNKDGWKWEFTRRNENYRKAYDEMVRLFDKICQNLDCSSCKIKGPGPCHLNQAFDVADQFQIRPFEKITDYGVNIPDPKFKYIELPDKIKPVTLKKPVRPLKVLTGYQMGRAIDANWEKNKSCYDQTGHHDPNYAMCDFVYDILSPDPDSIYSRDKDQQTLFIGLSLAWTKNELRAALEEVLKKHVRSKTNPGDPKQTPDKWKMGLMVWDLRALYRISFNAVKDLTGFKVDSSKKRFYRIYELIYDKKYNPAYYERPEIKKENLKRHCGICEKRRTCDGLCPDVLGYYNQDFIKQRERPWASIENVGLEDFEDR